MYFLNGKINPEKLQENQNKIFLSTTILGELYFGAANSGNPTKNQIAIEQFVSLCELLPITENTAKTYATVKHQLKKQGTPIPENDIWIAATAIEHSLTLITHDQHFQKVNSIILEDWF